MPLRIVFWTVVAGGLIGASVFGRLGWWAAVVGIVLGWITYRSFASFTQHYQAASNSLLAKLTYEALSPTEQESVMTRVKEILASEGQYPANDPEGTLKILPEAAIFGFAALAMGRMGIPPRIGGKWYSIANPYVAILGANKEIAFVRHKLKQKLGVDVDVALQSAR